MPFHLVLFFVFSYVSYYKTRICKWFEKIFQIGIDRQNNNHTTNNLFTKKYNYNRDNREDIFWIFRLIENLYVSAGLHNYDIGVGLAHVISN